MNEYKIYSCLLQGDQDKIFNFILYFIRGLAFGFVITSNLPGQGVNLALWPHFIKPVKSPSMLRRHAF